MKKVYVDGEKIRALLKERNITMSEASRGCGYESNYLNIAIARTGYFSEMFARYLDREYGIVREEYAPTLPQPEKESGKTVVQAMIEAIEEQTEEIRKLRKSLDYFISECKGRNDLSTK